MNSINVDVIDIINQDRKKFGLGELDFHRYRVHCTNKLKNLRKSIGIQQVNNVNKKFEKNSFDLQKINKNPRLHIKYLLINLFQVEHSWASSRETREQIQVTLKKIPQLGSNQSPSSCLTGVSRLRKHSQNRLAKAVKHSDELLGLCNLPSNPLTVETLAQVYVLRLYMKGLFDFEMARWESSLDHFVISFTILRALGNSSAYQVQDHKRHFVFYEFMDELSPMIRYCGYKLGLDSFETNTFSQERFDQNRINQDLIKETGWNQIKTFIDSSKKINAPVIELNFIDRWVSIRNPELIDLINHVRKADQILESALKIPSTLDTLSPTTDQSRATNLNKRHRRELFLQSKNPKLFNSKLILTSSTTAFDRALSIYTEAENSLQNIIESNNRTLKSNSTIQRFDEQSKLLATIHEIVGFRLLSTRVQRDLRLIDKIEKRRKNQEAKIQDRIKKNPVNFELINKLVMVSKNRHLMSNQNFSIFNNGRNKSYGNYNSQSFEIELIHSLLIKRRQAQLFPSLLKLIEDIIFNLDRIKQLNFIEENDLLALKIEAQVSFFRGYSCFIQSQSYLLIEKFLESYALQQKSMFYVRKTRSILEEIEQGGEQESEEFGEEEKKKMVLNFDFFNFDQTRLNLLGDEIQDRLKLKITTGWIKKAEEQAESDDDEAILQAKAELENLSLVNDSSYHLEGFRLNSTHSTVFDLAFNYLTQFDWNRLVENHQRNSASASQSGISKDTTPRSAVPQSTDLPKSTNKVAPPAPSSKSGGLWSFFSRS